MNKPLCRLCKSRHWSHEPHVFSEPAVVEGIARALKRPPPPTEKLKQLMRDEEEVEKLWSQCPRCKARMAKQAEANRRWREKRKKKGGEYE